MRTVPFFTMAVLGVACGARTTSLFGEPDAGPGMDGGSAEGDAGRTLEPDECSMPCDDGLDISPGGGLTLHEDGAPAFLFVEIESCGAPGTIAPAGIRVILRARTEDGAEEILEDTETYHAIPRGFHEVIPFEIPEDVWNEYSGDGHCLEIVTDPDDEIAECKEVNFMPVTGNCSGS